MNNNYVPIDPPMCAGQTWRIDFGHGNPNNGLIHIRAVVDDEFVVYRAWVARKRTWDYTVVHSSYFHHIFQMEALKIEADKDGGNQ